MRALAHLEDVELADAELIAIGLPVLTPWTPPTFIGHVL
jgi:hypothetical protein